MTGPANNRGAKVGLINVIAMPIVIIALATGILIYNLVSTISILANGGEIVYDEEVLNTYLTTNYSDSFKGTGVEQQSGMVIFFLYNEDTNQMEFTIKPGSNIRSDVTAIFATDSEFGTYLKNNVKSDSYEATLSKSLSGVMTHMAEKVEKLDLTSNFSKNYDESKMAGSALKIKEGFGFTVKNDEINASLAAFEAETGIPVVIVLDTAVNAFGRTTPVTDILMIVLLVAVIALCTASMIKKIRTYNRLVSDFGNAAEPNKIHVNARSPYYDEDDDEPIEGEAKDVSDDESEEEDNKSEEE